MNITEESLLNNLLETLKSWNKDLRETRNDYKESIIAIDKARTQLESQTKSKLKIALDFAPWIMLFLVLLAIIIIFLNFKCGTITFQELSYSVPCHSK